MRHLPGLLVLFAVGCGEPTLSVDAVDLGRANGPVFDLAVSKSTTQSDLATPVDLAVQHDLAKAADLALPTDLAVPFDLHTTTILNSPSDVANWAVTTHISKVDLDINGFVIDFNKKGTMCADTPYAPTTVSPGSWPDVPFGAGGSIEYTVWIIEQIGSTWYASGGIECWCGRDRNGGPPSGYGANWYYDPGRWGAMANHAPTIGSRVGFMVTQGDARNNGASSIQERSDIAWVTFPPDSGGVFTF